MSFISTILDYIMAFVNWVWGIPMLILLAGGGIYLLIRLHGVTLTKLPFILKNTIGKAFGKNNGSGDGKHSGWQAATGALASCLGTGNIVGTALAVAYGGPGAVFWLWVAGFVACTIKFCEVTMCMLHRHINKDTGEWEGGPGYYLSEATGKQWPGFLYGIFCLLAMLVCASVQIGSGVDNLEAFGAPRIPSTIILTVLCAVVVIGGMNSLLKVTEKVVPTMSILFIVGALVVIFANITKIPGIFATIFASAFTGHAAVGGFAGCTIMGCIRWGLARGVFSSDAGAGYTTMSHAVADTNHPVKQGMWGVFEGFFDTIIVCTLTCLTILCTGVWQWDGLSSSAMTMTAFGTVLGRVGSLLVVVCLLLFTFSTACAQVEFACVSLVRLVGEKGRAIGRWIILALILVGGFLGVDALIGYVDLSIFLITIVNTPIILLCCKQVVNASNEYFSNPTKWDTEKWPKWEKMEEEYQEEKSEEE